MPSAYCNAFSIGYVHGKFAEIGLLFPVEVEIFKLEVSKDHTIVKRFHANDGEERLALCCDADVAIGDVVNVSELDVVVTTIVFPPYVKLLVDVGDQIGKQHLALAVVFLRFRGLEDLRLTALHLYAHILKDDVMHIRVIAV